MSANACLLTEGCNSSVLASSTMYGGSWSLKVAGAHGGATGGMGQTEKPVIPDAIRMDKASTFFFGVT